MRVLLGSAAKTDLEAESKWYAEIHPDLARDFLDEVREPMSDVGRFSDFPSRSCMSLTRCLSP